MMARSWTQTFRWKLATWWLPNNEFISSGAAVNVMRGAAPLQSIRALLRVNTGLSSFPLRQLMYVKILVLLLLLLAVCKAKSSSGAANGAPDCLT